MSRVIFFVYSTWISRCSLAAIFFQLKSRTPCRREGRKKGQQRSSCGSNRDQSVWYQEVLARDQSHMLESGISYSVVNCRLGWHSDLTSSEKSWRDSNEKLSVMFSNVTQRRQSFSKYREIGGERKLSVQALRDPWVECRKGEVAPPVSRSPILDTQKFFVKVRQKLNRPEDDPTVVDHEVNVLLRRFCQQQWEQQWISEKITVTTCSLRGRPTSIRSRRCSTSRRNCSSTWCTISGTSPPLNGKLLYGWDLLR